MGIDGRAAPERAAAGQPVPSTAAICARDLVVRYGTRVAVDGLSFSVGRGEVVALLGRNGAGKTSTVECLEGYRRPASGSVSVLGLDPVADHRRLVPRIGVMLQRGGVYPMLGPRQAFELFAAYYQQPEDPAALLELVGLAAVAKTPWRNLSGGEQARLSLALALVGRPDAVFLDEPTAGVDPEGRLVVREVVATLRERGCAVLVTTHELPEAERMADRVLIVDRGRSVAEGSPAAIAAAAGAGQVSFGAPAGLDVAALALVLGSPVREESPGRYRVDAAAGGGGVPTLTATLTAWLAERHLALVDLRVGRTLEEAFLAVVGEADEREGDTDGSPSAVAPGRATHRGDGDGVRSGGARRRGARSR